jgi:hypothetical protein
MHARLLFTAGQISVELRSVFYQCAALDVEDSVATQICHTGSNHPRWLACLIALDAKFSSHTALAVRLRHHESSARRCIGYAEVSRVSMPRTPREWRNLLCARGRPVSPATLSRRCKHLPRSTRVSVFQKSTCGVEITCVGAATSGIDGQHPASPLWRGIGARDVLLSAMARRSVSALRRAGKWRMRAAAAVCPTNTRMAERLSSGNARRVTNGRRNRNTYAKDIGASSVRTKGRAAAIRT